MAASAGGGDKDVQPFGFSEMVGVPGGQPFTPDISGYCGLKPVPFGSATQPCCGTHPREEGQLRADPRGELRRPICGACFERRSGQRGADPGAAVPLTAVDLTRLTNICSTLREYFDRQARGENMVGKEPDGYTVKVDVTFNMVVLYHEGTRIGTAVHCLDLVDRVDRRRVEEPTRIVFCYLPAGPFQTANLFLPDRPLAAWGALLDHRAVHKIAPPEPEEPRDSLVPVPDEALWYSGLTTTEPEEARLRSFDAPMSILRSRSRGSVSRQNSTKGQMLLLQESGFFHPGSFSIRLDFGVAIHVPERLCRTPPGEANRREIQVGEPLSELTLGVQGGQLVEAAARADVDAVRRLLGARADVGARDRRGWTALHAAAARRPCWELLELLVPMADLGARTLHGDLASDIAGARGHLDVEHWLEAELQRRKRGAAPRRG